MSPVLHPARLLKLGVVVGLLLVLLLLGTSEWVRRQCQGRITQNIDSLRPAPVGVVLGANRLSGSGLNPFYAARMEAAADLFKQRKVRGLLVSGDNHRANYNEPDMMREDLIRLGVPAEFITRDYAGFRTLDSVVRAKEVFQQPEVILISQRSHLERALLIARERGLSAQGFVAKDPSTSWLIRNRIRESIARLGACLDLWVWHRGPHFLGPPERVALRDS